MRGVLVIILLIVALSLSDLSFAKINNKQDNTFLKAFPHANREDFYKLALNEHLFKVGQLSRKNMTSFKACAPISPAPPTNDVNNLRPGNIKVVMAMGDSVTAAMSAKDTSILDLNEYRGLSYCIGGDSGINTVPNILTQFAPDGVLIGASHGVGERSSSGNGLNAAESGAINNDMLGQANWLVQELLADPNIDFDNDWKLLTIWIGNNNLCDVCDNKANNDAVNFQTQLTNALEYLYSNVPRLFVNVVSNLDITQLYNFRTLWCSIVHAIACPCVGSSSNSDRNAVKEEIPKYQAAAVTIANSFNSRKNPLFAVVVQPFLSQTEIDDIDLVSEADCFHPSAYAHGVAAIALWNNMVSPAAQKKTAWNINDVPICPTDDTLLYTN